MPLVPLILDHNVRNTRQIANAFQPLVDHPMRFLGGDGPAVTFVACGPDEAMDVGDDQVEAPVGRRLAAGRPRTAHHRQPTPGADRAPARRAPRLLGHVLGHRPGVLRPRARLQGPRTSRGRPRRQRGIQTFERSRERLYVGLSRARDQLVVCGDPEFIRDVGGPDLASRLNLSRRR